MLGQEHLRPAAAAPPTALPAADPLDYVARGEELRRNNYVVVLRSGGEALEAMLGAIASAQRHVHLSAYILRADKIGRRFQEALSGRARSGCRVRLLYDALGSLGLPSSYVEELRNAGVEVAIFHPIAPWRPRWGLNRRNHQKILICDGKVGVTGGMNIGDEYAPEPDGGGWYDMGALIEGPVVQDLESAFARTWKYAVGESYPAATGRMSQPQGSAFHTLAYSVDNVNLRRRSRMYRDYLHAIRTARATISIMSAYFIPDIRLRRQFRHAVRRGAEVRVIVPSVTDVPIVRWASRNLYGRLLRGGVRIFEWPERMMHAKMGVIDSTWATIGSYNLDTRSFLHNFEHGIVMLDREIGADLEQRFRADLTRCREVTLAEWTARSPRERLLDWFGYRARYWL